MTVVTGKTSWFGGPQDPTAGPTTASGAPVTKPGLAVYNQATLGGWWLTRLPNGVLSLIQQTDIGPAPWTGRKFDFTYSSLPSLGYSTANFPTDGTVSAVYLGKTNSQVIPGLIHAAADLGANVPNIAGWIKQFANGPSFGTTKAGGSTVGPFDTGALDLGNQKVQPAGPTSALDVLAGFLGKLSDPATWLKVLEVIGGLALAYLAIRQFTQTASAS